MAITADQIERRVESMTDRLDARFMADNSDMTQAEYDARQVEIAAWADMQYSILDRSKRVEMRLDWARS